MKGKKQIAFVTGSRADYGIMRRYLKLLNDDRNIQLEIIATGALLEELFGHQVELIYADGFKVKKEIKLELDSSSNRSVLHTMADGLDKFAEFFQKNSYDLLVILGDRYEMLSVAIAAAMQRIPILHIHGGEATFANYDEFIRHCITKMSLYHFTATDAYRKRVIQLGENPQRVFNLGALGAENCMYIDEKNVTKKIKGLPDKGYFVILFHPETLTNIDVSYQTEQLLIAIEKYKEYHYVFLGTNADTNSEKIRNMIQKFVEMHDNTTYYENLHTDEYHYLLKHAICLIGNSSSGIIEAPSLKIYTINIGDRQAGRVRGNSVIDVVCSAEKIQNAMKTVLEEYKTVIPINPYLQENSANRYYDTTKILLEKLNEDCNSPKIFYDCI